MRVAKAKQRIDYDIEQETPCYKYIGRKGFWLEEELLEFGAVFYMDADQEPNTDLEPMNQLACDLMNKFLDKLDQCGAEKAAKDGKAFAKRPRNFNGAFEMPTEESRTVQLTKDGPGVPLMGAKRKGRPPKMRKLEPDNVPDTTREFVPQVGIVAT